MRGWRVLTRPPSSSGTSVSSSTRDDVDAELGDVGGRAAARDDLDSEVGESTGEDIQPGLVEDRHEGAPHLHG